MRERERENNYYNILHKTRVKKREQEQIQKGNYWGGRRTETPSFEEDEKIAIWVCRGEPEIWSHYLPIILTVLMTWDGSWCSQGCPREVVTGSHWREEGNGKEVEKDKWGTSNGHWDSVEDGANGRGFPQPINSSVGREGKVSVEGNHAEKLVRGFRGLVLGCGLDR